MVFHNRSPRGPVKYRARFVKGELPDWIEAPGTLMRATAHILRVSGESQIPGYQTVRPQHARLTFKGQPGIITKQGDFGLYLGKKHVRQKHASGREQVVAVPTFWFNGFRIVFTTMSSYDDAVVCDDVYDDWHSQQL